MTEEYWVAVLKEEDRLLSNSDRKYRYHCNSLESMSEELTFQESCFYIQEDFTVQCEIRDFKSRLKNIGLLSWIKSSKNCMKIISPANCLMSVI